MTRLARSTAIAAPLVFVALVIVQGVRHPDYSHLAQPISALAAWPLGWLQSVNFIVLAMGMLAFALVVDHAVAPDRSGRSAPALFAVCALGLALAAAFPWARDAGGFTVPRAHLAGALLTFAGVGGGLIVTARRMRNDEAWRSAAGYTLASGVAVLVLFVVTFAVAQGAIVPLAGSAGLLQRVTLAVWLPCMIAIAWQVTEAA